MKFFVLIKEIIKNMITLYVSFFLIGQFNLFQPYVFAMNDSPDEHVTEELRLKVPEKYKDNWIKAEKKIWEPWLSVQEGFLGRQMFWDKEKEEALILVTWKSKKLWKSISIKEVNEVQEKFEDNVKTVLNVSENPFEFIYEGELDKQG